MSCIEHIYCLNELHLVAYGQVVTGSTHGIGKAYAQELASHGMDILVISIGDEDCQRTCTLLGQFFFIVI